MADEPRPDVISDREEDHLDEWREIFDRVFDEAREPIPIHELCDSCRAKIEKARVVSDCHSYRNAIVNLLQ